jgi:hypothetical protein
VTGAGDPRTTARYEIDTPAASISIARAGEYRIAVSSHGQPLVERDPFAETELIVFRGEAVLTTERGTASVRAGERSAALVDDLPQTPRRFNSARFDAFDRWSAEQQNARVGSASAAFLPSNLQMYSGTFDTVRHLAAGSGVRVRVVSDDRARLAALPSRLLVCRRLVRLDMDWCRSLELADAPLRALGTRARILVLDSGTHVERRVGIVGRRAWLCQLVPARVRQPARL